MLRWLARLGMVVLSICSACGGNTAGGGSSSDPDGEPTSTPSDPNVTPGASGMPGASDNPNADTELGECKLGVAAYGEGASPCPWVVDNRCYVTRAMACNCACPRDRDSQCFSSFESGPDGRVDVYCL